MGMGLGFAIGADVPMHIEVGDHAARDELALDKIPRQFDALFLIHLARNGELHLTDQLGVLPLLGHLDRIPQTFALMEFFGSVFPRQYFGMNDTALAREIVMAIQPLVIEPLG